MSSSFFLCKIKMQFAFNNTWLIVTNSGIPISTYFFQADVCHSYQLVKRGGLKDENIIVFMYDDIASDEENPRPGVIINHPQGDNVYQGVPKVYFLCFHSVGKKKLCLTFFS